MRPINVHLLAFFFFSFPIVCIDKLHIAQYLYSKYMEFAQLSQRWIGSNKEHVIWSKALEEAVKCTLSLNCLVKKEILIIKV